MPLALGLYYLVPGRVKNAVLLVESLNVDPSGNPIEWARAWFAGDRVKLTIDHHEH